MLYPHHHLSLEDRVIHKNDYQPCAEAFVDTRLRNRDGKLNYCIIGPGVAENDSQFIHIAEPHGFNVGGVSLPTGKFNSLHSHLTAEVFIVVRGVWRFFWGHDGKDGEQILKPGDIISIPTGCFRAFESIGSDDNFMFSLLGEDDPGAITWENEVIEGAANFGFYLTKDARLIDTRKGDLLPANDELIRPLSKSELLNFHRVSEQEMAARIYNVNENHGYIDIFADEQRNGGMKRYHPIIGETMSELYSVRSHILNPHSFSLAAIKSPPNNGFLKHTIDAKQVMIVGSGKWLIEIEHNNEFLMQELMPEDTVSIPENAVRSITNIGMEDGILYSAISGNEAANIIWM